jgi:hypothetical protein
MMLDHSYDVDEIFALYPRWRHAGSERRKSDVVADYCDILFDKAQEDGADDWATLVCAMETLYKTLDRQVRDPSVQVVHLAYYEHEEYLEFILGN